MTQSGTPGMVNSVADPDIPPAIVNIAHWPVIPTSSDQVTISAQVVDEQMTGLSVTLFFRISTEHPEPFRQQAMFDDGRHRDGSAGDGLFATQLHAYPDGTVFEFYVLAVDATGQKRTSPGPTDETGAQQANALFQVDDTDWPSEISLYRSIMAIPDLAAFEQLDRKSNAQFNATFVATLGGRTEFRYNVGVRYRGNITRFSIPPNNRVNIPADRPWLGRTELNLNVELPERQIAASTVLALAGVPAADAFPVRYIHNGRDLTQGGYYADLESFDSSWVDDHFPLDDGGNLYRATRTGRGSGLRYFGEDPARYSAYEKQTNAAERDWSDVIELTRVLRESPDETYVEDVSRVMDLNQWLRTIATLALIGYRQPGLFTGWRPGGDYAIYRGVSDPRFMIIPHDLAESFHFFRPPLVLSRLASSLDRLLSIDEVQRRLYRQFEELIVTTLSKDRVRSALYEVLGPVESRDIIEGFVNDLQRRGQATTDLILNELSARSELPVIDDLPRSHTARSGLIQGTANAAQTRSILVDGQQAEWNLHDNQCSIIVCKWSINDLLLNPGINRLRVLAIGENGVPLDRANVDIWSDTGSVQQVTDNVGNDTVWTSNQGPYHISGNAVVESDATLTIEPGTTVFFDEGARLTVAGRLIAEGTIHDPIWFTRVPGSSSTWRGIQFLQSMRSNRIQHAVVAYAVSDDGMVGIDGSQLELDYVTFEHSDSRRIRSVDSSLTVRNSNVFDLAVPVRASISGEPASRTSQTSATLIVGGPGVSHYRYRVNEGSFGQAIPVSETIQLDDLEDGKYTVYVIAGTDAGAWQTEQDATSSLSWTVDTRSRLFYINEVLAWNDAVLNLNGSFPDAVELFNPSVEAIDLSGMSITDKPNQPERFTFPGGTTIRPGEFLVVYADRDNSSPGFHLGFGLNRDGDGVFIFDSPARGGNLVDFVTFGIQASDISIGRDRDGQWTANIPTLGRENEPLPLGDPSAIRINEWLAHTEMARSEDYIELFNPNSLPVALEGMFLTDNPFGWPDRHEISPLSFIGPNDFAVFLADSGAERGANHVSFRLARDHGSIALFDHELNLIDDVRYGPQHPDIASGISPEDPKSITPFPLPSPGRTNSLEPDPNSLAIYAGLRVSEIMYNPIGGGKFEFIEFRNASDEPTQLEGVKIVDGVEFTFPDVTLWPNEYIVVVNDVNAFQSRYGDNVATAGVFAGNLDNSGERIVIQLPPNYDLNILAFEYDDSWYSSTDGNGYSLIVDDQVKGRSHWSNTMAWRPSARRDGSPGSIDSVLSREILIEALQAGKYMTGEPATMQEGDWNRDGVFNQLDIVLVLQEFS